MYAEMKLVSGLTLFGKTGLGHGVIVDGPNILGGNGRVHVPWNLSFWLWSGVIVCLLFLRFEKRKLF